MDRISTLAKVIKMLHGRLVHVCKTLTDLQILGCELHQNAFGGRSPPWPTGELYHSPRPSAITRVWEGTGRGRA